MQTTCCREVPRGRPEAHTDIDSRSRAGKPPGTRAELYRPGASHANHQVAGIAGTQRGTSCRQPRIVNVDVEPANTRPTISGPSTAVGTRRDSVVPSPS